jgi:hypothetical protein
MTIPVDYDAQFQVGLVGTFGVLNHGVPIEAAEPGSREARTLLPLLAVERTHVVPVRRIAAVL